jgi:hypothetical protein
LHGDTHRLLISQDMQPQPPVSAFPVLAELLNGDADRLALVLHAIHSAISDDLSRLDVAVRRGDGRLAREVAQRAATACHLFGETTTGERLAAIQNVHPRSSDKASHPHRGDHA